MFCTYCEKKLESDANFCTNCGKRIDAAAKDPAAAGHPSGNAGKGKQEGVSPLCVAGFVLICLVFLFDDFMIGVPLAFIVSIVGCVSAKKRGQAGVALAVIAMIVSGAILAVFFTIFGPAYLSRFLGL